MLKALLGHNPYRLELEQARKDYDLIAKTEARTSKMADDLHVLTEYLRKVIKEKDIKIHRQAKNYQEELIKMRDFYGKSIEDRDEKIAGLREDLDETLERLQEANRMLAKDSMA